MKSIKKNYIYSLIYNALLVIIPLFITPYLSRILGVEGVGIKSYTLSVVSFFILFSNLGISTYGQQEISKNRENQYQYSKIFYELAIFRFISTICLTAFYYIIFVSLLFNQNYNTIYLILIINLIANALDFSWFLQGLEEFKKIALFQIISKIVYCVCIFLFIREKTDLDLCILLTSLSLLLTSVLITITVKKYCIKVNFKELKIFFHLKECLVYFIPAIAVQIYTVLDKTMIGIISGTYENGYYEQADKIVQICFSVCTSLNVIMRSRMSYLFKKKDSKNIKIFMNKSLNFMGIITIPMVFGLIAIAPIFVPIFFGDSFQNTAIVLSIISPVIFIAGISNLLGSHYFTPSGRRRISNKGLIIGAIVNFLLNSILIYKFASVGAAIATVVAETVVSAIYLHYAKNILTVRDILKCDKLYFIAGIFMLLILYFMRMFLEVSVISLILLVLIGILVYFVVLFLLKDRFLLEIITMVKKKIGCDKSENV